MAKIKGVHHIALKAKGLEEFERLVHFYRDILGMPVVRTWGEGEHLGMMVSTGDAMMELFSDADSRLQRGAIQHLALATDDVDGCIEAVRAEGFEVTMEPKDIVIGSEPPFPARIAFCIGAVGEEVEFFCEK
ncbi:MAG: VOC family protein [Clostridia bacterium]|nr:VOC family protein [Clostridia bacterium]